MSQIATEEEDPQMKEGGDDAPVVEEKKITPLDPIVRELIFTQNNDVGNATRFETALEEGDDSLIYVEERREWYYWNGTRWIEDTGSAKATRLFIGMINKLISETKKADGSYFHKTEPATAKRNKDRIIGFLKATLNRGKITSALDIAAKLKGLRKSSSELDLNLWIASCANGDIELKRQELLDPDQDRLITKQLNATFNKEAKCPRWDLFIEEVTQGDKELAIYLQKYAGYCLTGDTEEHFALNLTGQGSNGKSVFTNALYHIWGDYGTKVPNDVITKQGRGGGGDESKASPQTAMLQGARLALTSELEEGMWIGESKFKDIVSSDEITARRLHKDPETFVPTHKLVFCGNHQPNIKGNDDGIWRRIKQVKFEAKIDKPDKTLPEQFRAEEAKSYILNWALEGLSMYQENRKEYGKIQEPEIVTKWNKQYRANEDLLLQFIEDYCNVFSQAETTQSMLRLVYEEWAENSGYHPMTAIALGKSLEQRGFTRRPSNGVRLWCGIEVRKDKLPRVEELNGTRYFSNEQFQRKLPQSHFEWWEKYEREKEEGKRFQWEGTPF